MSSESRKWSAPPTHVLEYSFGRFASHRYHVERETPKPADNLTPSERRLHQAGRLSWKERQPITEQQRNWHQQARGPRR